MKKLIPIVVVITVGLAGCAQGPMEITPQPLESATIAEPTPTPSSSPSSSQPEVTPNPYIPEDDGFSGGGTNKAAYLTIQRGGYFLVPLPSTDITTESVAADPTLVAVAKFDAMPTWDDGLPARAVNSPASAYWQAGDSAGKTTITTTFTKDGKPVKWTLDVTVE